MSEVLLTKIVQDNIGHLTRWAKVAFCARVARRVFPLYRELNVRAPEHFIAIERAISLAEERASKGENDELRDPYDQQALAGTLHAIVEAALNTKADASGGVPVDIIYIEASAYLAAAETAEAAYLTAFKDDLSEEDLDIDKWTIHCAEVAVTASPSFNEFISVALIHDLDLLCHNAQTDKWNDNTPVSSSVFGPLWPAGAPNGWPAEQHFFKPRARLMLLLGDELIKDAGIAVFELVKNAYDADAKECHIILQHVDVASSNIMWGKIQYIGVLIFCIVFVALISMIIFIGGQVP